MGSSMLDTYEELKKAADEYGDAFYIVDSSLFEKNYKDMLSAFRRYYPDTHIAYSYKTNYMPRLCGIVQKNGGYAEVVSEMEWMAAVKLGVKPSDIYYNGPYKKKEYMEKCMLTGVHINLDSMYETEIVSEIAERYEDRDFEVGVRCNMDIGQEEPSRFGFDVSSGTLANAVGKLDSLPNVQVTGLHSHLPYRSLDSYRDRVSVLREIVAQMFYKDWTYISVGGGVFGKCERGTFKRVFL